MEKLHCPGPRRQTRSGPGRPLGTHRCYAWGVLDRLKGRVVAIGSERSIVLLEDFDYEWLDKLPWVDVPEHVRALEAEGQKSERWAQGMAASEPRAPRPAPPDDGRRPWRKLSDAELYEVREMAKTVDRSLVARRFGISATDVLRIKHGMVGR